MYAYIKGIVDEKGIDRAVVEAAGVGYELLCPDSTLREITAGREAKLLAHFNITQDGVACTASIQKKSGRCSAGS